MNQKERLLRPTQMLQRLIVRLSALCLLAFLGVGLAAASPFEEVRPGDDLYQRVKALEKYGLLAPEDQAVLDRGETVTRLQLAFYTEKAKTRIREPFAPQAAPTAVTTEPVIVAPAAQPAAMPELVAPVAQPTAEPQPTAIAVTPAIKQEIDDLLKAMKNESAYLKARQPLLDANIKAEEDELKEIRRIQTAAEGVVRKANKNSGDWSFNTNATWHFEDMTVRGQNATVLTTASGSTTLSPVAAQRITKMNQDIYFGMWGSLGKGSLSTGFGGSLPSSNDNSWPVSLYLGKPEFKMTLDGRFGTWNFFAMDEGFHGETTMGNFTRGVAASRPKRYDSPFNIKCWSPDKFDKNWDDYIRSLGFVATQSLLGGLGQSTSDRVFDGITMDGSDLPLVGPAKVKVLAGRMLRPTWFEYGVLVQRPWMDIRFTTKVAGLWVDDSSKTPGQPSVDLRNYTGELSVNLKPLPLALSAEFARSHFFTGVDTASASGALPLIGQAFQWQISSYPFNFYYQDIRPEYSNFQSKVDMTSIDFSRYGVARADLDEIVDRYGEIGEADLLQNNRKGWRANFGWNGRRDEWMKKSLPKFLDFVVLNLDVAQRKEHQSILSSEAGGHYVVEPWCFVAPYYPEDEGIWGLELYGGYGGSPKPTRATVNSNIYQTRKALDPSATSTWNSSFEWVRYRFQMSSERVPLVDPATGADLSHLKTYKYIAFSNKWQFNQLFNSSKPLYLGLYVADNVVSGKAVVADQTDIARMFHQSVFDVTVMAGRLLPYVQVLGHFAREKWDSNYTIPAIRYDTKSTGVGLDYNVPWGSAKIGLRYNHVVFESKTVSSNNYVAEQVWAQGNFRF